MDKSAVKRDNIGAEVARRSCRVGAAVSTPSVSDSEVAEFQVDFGTFFAQQLSMDMRRDDELKIFTTDQEDLDLDENPTVENTQVTDLSEHEHDVRGKRQRHSSMHQPMQEKKKTEGDKGGRRNEREERRKSEREMFPGKESEHNDEDGKSCKSVQIFVKVDGCRTVAMDVSQNDKVGDMMNRIPNGGDMYVKSGGRVLRRSDELRSCGVVDGSTVQVVSRMRAEEDKDKRSKAEKK